MSSWTDHTEDNWATLADSPSQRPEMGVRSPWTMPCPWSSQMTWVAPGQTSPGQTAAYEQRNYYYSKRLDLKGSLCSKRWPLRYSSNWKSLRHSRENKILQKTQEVYTIENSSWANNAESSQPDNLPNTHSKHKPNGGRVEALFK